MPALSLASERHTQIRVAAMAVRACAAKGGRAMLRGTSVYKFLVHEDMHIFTIKFSEINVLI